MHWDQYALKAGMPAGPFEPLRWEGGGEPLKDDDETPTKFLDDLIKAMGKLRNRERK